jgi:predicted ATPase
MLGDKRFLRSILLRNLLSFGPETPELELKSLNVLIGPNGSGKSNLIEAISLLQACPNDLLDPIRMGGGIEHWLWKGSDSPPVAEVNVCVSYPQEAIRHRFKITTVARRAEMVDEAVENERLTNQKAKGVYFYYRYQEGHPVLNVRSAAGAPRPRKLLREDLRIDQSVLSQRKDPDQYPEVTYLGSEYSKIKIYRDWNFSRGATSRQASSADLPNSFLAEDARNLVLVLNRLENQGTVGQAILEKLRDADGSIVRYSFDIEGGTVQLNMHYEGLQHPVPLTRLSDGTVRYLALLSVLCHPSPPPLVCLEEPELGIHPDLLPGLADLLVDASQRMQLIVTTHSEILVDGLTRTPETVIVCGKEDGATQLTRPSPKELKKWLADYRLGQLWRSGEIGGNRW